MINIYTLSDSDISKRIAKRLRDTRLRQNISQQSLAQSADVSLSSVIRAEEGNIKSFETLIRIMRTLGNLDIFTPLVEEEPLSPNEYFKLVNSAKNNKRKRAAKSTRATTKQEELEW